MTEAFNYHCYVSYFRVHKLQNENMRNLHSDLEVKILFCKILCPSIFARIVCGIVC